MGTPLLYGTRGVVVYRYYGGKKIFTRGGVKGKFIMGWRKKEESKGMFGGKILIIFGEQTYL